MNHFLGMHGLAFLSILAEDLVHCLELQGEVSLVGGQGRWEYGKVPLSVML